jgi:hypothetical protein
VIDFASLLWFAAYGGAFLGIGLVLRFIARWSGGTSLADAFGGSYREPPWPQGVQEEEPVRWDVQRLRRPNPSRRQRTEAGATAAALCPSIGRLDPTCR